MDRGPTGPGRRLEQQRGHLMAGLMAALAILLIFSTIVFQDWREAMRRENEAEMMFRAQEIVRAIARYRKEARLLPEKLEDLMEPGPQGQYFLRHLYDDPLVQDGKWGLLYAGPGGTIIDPNQMPGGTEGGLSGLPGLGSGTTDLDQSPADGQGAGQRPGDPADPAAAGAVQIAGGQTVGVRIAGVKSLCTEKPFRVYKGFTEYREWLFTYLDLEVSKLPGQGDKAGRPGRPGRPGRGGGLNRPAPGSSDPSGKPPRRRR